MAYIRDRWAIVLGSISILFLSTSMASGQGALQQLEESLDATPPVQGATRATDGELPEPIPAIERGPTVIQDNRPSLGITVVDVTRANQTRYGLTVRRGALISDVRAGTAAAKYGLPIGGAIVAIDGRRIDSANDLVATIETYQPGDEVEITYFDGDRMGRKKIRLGRRAAAITPSGPAAREHQLDELAMLRQQVSVLQRQLELLQQRMDELDRRLPKPESAPDEQEPPAESKPADQPRDAANSP